MNCFTHKNTVAVGVCRICGAGVCASCAQTLPALCPDCKIAAAQKALKRLAQNNRIMLYLGLFFGALLFAISYIVYLNNENLLYFLLNIPTLVMTLVFILLFFKNKQKKQSERKKILAASELKSLKLPVEGLTKECVQKMILAAVTEITSKLQVQKPTVEEPKEILSEVAPPPKEEIKEKNNPFIPAKPKTASRQKSSKKLWCCDCGKENPTSKLFCMECGLKRTKEMLQNAKEVE